MNNKEYIEFMRVSGKNIETYTKEIEDSDIDVTKFMRLFVKYHEDELLIRMIDMLDVILNGLKNKDKETQEIVIDGITSVFKSYLDYDIESRKKEVLSILEMELGDLLESDEFSKEKLLKTIKKARYIRVIAVCRFTISNEKWMLKRVINTDKSYYFKLVNLKSNKEINGIEVVGIKDNKIDLLKYNDIRKLNDENYEIAFICESEYFDGHYKNIVK